MRISLVAGPTARLVDLWIRVQSSYWFVPSVMTTAAVMLALAMVGVDRAAPGWARNTAWVAANQPEGARALLATVAGSMITVAGVTFSMTLLMVSFASTQLGARLVPRFLRDRGNQFVLGTFIATFIYCLVVLRTVRSATEASIDASSAAAFVPHLAILVAVVLALLSVAVLIYFVHHVPAMINTSSVIGLLGEELLAQLRRDYPHAEEHRRELTWPAECSPGEPLRLTDGGCYLRIVDYEGLVTLAQRTKRRLEVLVAPGAFCIAGAPIARVHGGRLDESDRDKLLGLFAWGGERTPDQDILFLVDQLAEVAGKALSTGVNDQFTALLCIDQMERMLCAAAQRREPDAVHGVEGKGWVRATHTSLPEVAERFLMPLRQFSRSDLLSTDRLLAMIESCIARQPERSPLHETLRRHRDGLLDEAASALPSEQRALLAARRAERSARSAEHSAR